jgi:hypothetical protein
MTKKMIKDLMSTGVASMAGMGAMGTMSSMPGMPKQASGITGTVGAGLTLANLGNVTKAGMSVMPGSKHAWHKHKHHPHKVVKNILGR